MARSIGRFGCLRALLVAMAGFFGAAQTACAFIVYKVGGDADCPYTNIQDAIDAAAANLGEDYVWIANNQSYTGQQVHVANQDVDIEGGFTDCNDFDPGNDYTTISGAGNGGGAVFTITGTSRVFFGNLLIRGGQRNGDATGGGIEFDGTGGVTLQTTTLTQNYAGYGGGINMKASGGPAVLTLLHDSAVLLNTAYTSGGGIRIEGDTRLFVLAPYTLIGYNHAQDGYGGGIEVLGPARADIGSPGYNGGAVLQFNDAQYGGGIAALAINDQQDATVRLFTTDPQHPVQIVDNSAAATGGGIYLKPLQGIDSQAHASLCASDFRIDDNLAQEGAAVYGDEDNDGLGLYLGANVLFNQNSPCGPETPPALGAVPCAPGVACNEIDRNLAQDSNGQPTPGAAILIQSAGSFLAERFSMRGNLGAHALRGVEAGRISLQDCLLADNQATQELINVSSDFVGPFSMQNCTLADNQIGASPVLLVSANSNSVTLLDSIVHQPGVLTLDAANANPLTVNYMLSTDISTLPGLPGVIQGEPSFVDAANGDYHLQASSLGVDFAPAAGGSDLDRNPRTVDLPGVPNVHGPLDLGAYELQSGTVVVTCANADTIFCDGFDGG